MDYNNSSRRFRPCGFKSHGLIYQMRLPGLTNWVTWVLLLPPGRDASPSKGFPKLYVADMQVIHNFLRGQNRPLPSSKNLHFQNEGRCTTFLVKMSFICMRMKNDFHIKGWAPTLVLKQRPGGTRKWPITNAVEQAPAGYLHPYLQKHKLCPTNVCLQCFQ